MKRYIAVDSGKGHTKVATYDVTSNTVTKATFPTRYDEGTFEDTDPGSSTFLVQMNGRTYKVGRNAANGAELTSSKKTFVPSFLKFVGSVNCKNLKLSVYSLSQ